MLDELLELYWPGHMEKEHGYVPNIYWALRIIWLLLIGCGLSMIGLSGWSENPLYNIHMGTSIIIGTSIAMFLFAFVYWVVRCYHNTK